MQYTFSVNRYIFPNTVLTDDALVDLFKQFEEKKDVIPICSNFITSYRKVIPGKVIDVKWQNKSFGLSAFVKKDEDEEKIVEVDYKDVGYLEDECSFLVTVELDGDELDDRKY